VIFVPLLSNEVEDALQLVALRNGVREVRKLRADEDDEECVADRLAYLVEAQRRSRARRRS
jgi:hypothetical protein